MMDQKKVSNFCRSCKHLYDVDRSMEPYRGKCEVWECWQKCQDKACMHFELKERSDWHKTNTDSRPKPANYKHKRS